MTKRPSDLICPSCGRSFRRPSNRGRLPLFCSPSCRSSAYRARTTVRPGVPPEHDEAAVGVAEDIRDSVGLLLAAARSPASGAPVELVSRAVAMRQDAEDMLAVAVRKARSHGTTWEQIGLVTSMAAGSARGHWSSGQVARVLERRRLRAAALAAIGRPVGPPASAASVRRTEGDPADGSGAGNGPGIASRPGTGSGPCPACGPGTASGSGSVRGPEATGEPGAQASPGAAGGPDTAGARGPAGARGRRTAAARTPLGGGAVRAEPFEEQEGRERRAARHLARAMSHLRASRHGTARALAGRIGVSPSHLSLVLAGKRLPSWEVTESFARACDTDPGDLVQLWQQAHRIAPAPPRSPSEGQAALRTALRGLYLAAREPELPALGPAERFPGRDRAACLVDPAAPPPADWPVIARLVGALGGQEEDIRPLWLQAHALSGADRAARLGVPAEPGGLPAAAFG